MKLFNLILNLLTVAALALGLSAHADLASAFKKLEGNRKGPFTLNYLQGSTGRGVVGSGGSSGKFQFQAAFRNDDARVLSEQSDFYVANLFTTNYYELQGEFVYGDAYGSHDINGPALLAQSAKAPLSRKPFR